MTRSTLSLLVGGLILGLAPAAAAQVVTVTPAEQKLVVHVDQLVQKAEANTDISRDLVATTAFVTDWTQPEAGEPTATPESLRDRLHRAITDLQERARRSMLNARDVQSFRERVVNSRLERALNQLQREAQSRQPSREIYNRLVSLIQERARAARAVDPNAETMEERLTRAVTELQRAAAGQAAPIIQVELLITQVTDSRLDRALADLQRQVMNGRGTRNDFYRMSALLSARWAASQLLPGQDSTALRQRLDSALAQIEAAALAAIGTVPTGIGDAHFVQIKTDIQALRSKTATVTASPVKASSKKTGRVNYR